MSRNIGNPNPIVEAWRSRVHAIIRELTIIDKMFGESGLERVKNYRDALDGAANRLKYEFGVPDESTAEDPIIDTPCSIRAKCIKIQWENFPSLTTLAQTLARFRHEDEMRGASAAKRVVTQHLVNDVQLAVEAVITRYLDHPVRETPKPPTAEG